MGSPIRPPYLTLSDLERSKSRSLKFGLRSVSKQFACTRDRKFCKTFANVSILNAALVGRRSVWYAYIYLPAVYYSFNLNVTKGSWWQAGFSTVPAVFLVVLVPVHIAVGVCFGDGNSWHLL